MVWGQSDMAQQKDTLLLRLNLLQMLTMPRRHYLHHRKGRIDSVAEHIAGSETCFGV